MSMINFSIPDTLGLAAEAENEDDIATIAPASVQQAVVAATDWTTETLVRQFERGTIELAPSFQRRDAWTVERKSAFIESLLLGLPIPQIVLAERRDKRGHFVVLDGKQRLLTLQQFAAPGPKTGLRLTGLKVREDLNGYRYSDLVNDTKFAIDLNSLLNQTIRSVVIKNWPNEDFLYLVFLRLNTGSVPLAPQELRQALHPGPFVEHVNIYAGSSPGLRASLRINGPDFRMRDDELLVRYLALKLFLESYSGNMKQFLDKTCETLNAEWESRQDDVFALTGELEMGIKAAKSIFPTDSLFSTFRGAGYETRFNRAVFDIFTYYLTQPKIREGVETNPAVCRVVFENLTRENRRFSQALQTTTKSIESLAVRLNAFGCALREKLGPEGQAAIRIPTLVGGRLVLNT